MSQTSGSSRPLLTAFWPIERVELAVEPISERNPSNSKRKGKPLVPVAVTSATSTICNFLTDTLSSGFINLSGDQKALLNYNNGLYICCPKASNFFQLNDEYRLQLFGGMERYFLSSSCTESLWCVQTQLFSDTQTM